MANYGAWLKTQLGPSPLIGISMLVLTSMKRWLCPLPENEAKLPPGVTVQVAVAAATGATLTAIVSSQAAAIEAAMNTGVRMRGSKG